MVDDKFVDSTATQIYEESDGEDETASVGNTMKTQSFHQRVSTTLHWVDTSDLLDRSTG